MAAKKKTVFENPYFWAAVGGIGIAYYMYSKKNDELPVAPPGATLISAGETKAPVTKKKKTVKETIAGYLPSWLSGGSVDYGY
jgi:hypothetical protein